uniref:F-box/LRR-repeat protein 15-like leucin rich repeat domain-containing protein n=1 Tax=Strigamia maritima TaxID=126957 RepID=T1JAF0_STRMM
MHQHHTDSAPSLRKLCLFTITENIENLHRELVADKCLPLPLIEELFQVAQQFDLIQPSMIDIFIRPDTQKLYNLQQFKRNNEITDKISQVCKNLTHLSLRSCSDISHYSLVKFIPSIPHIITLNLSNTCASSSVLAAIPRHCSKLRHLDLSYCKRVNDNGISNLCSEPLKICKNPNPQTTRMKIITLNMQGTQVTPLGGICALKNLPELKTLRCNSFNRILDLLSTELEAFSESNNSATKTPQTYSLTTLYANTSKVNLNTATIVWPNIEKLKVGNMNDGLLSLTRFRNLQVLVIDGLCIDCNFDNIFVPLLQNINRNLKSLTISKVDSVDVSVIGYTCPMLECLRLDYITSNGKSNVEWLMRQCNHVPFKHLLRLELLFCKDDYMPKQHLRLLLENCKYLEKLRIINCQSLTDAVVKEVVKLNSFRKLSVLSLCRCNLITVSSLFTILKLAKCLKNVSIMNCKMFSNNDLKLLSLKFNLELVFK